MITIPEQRLIELFIIKEKQKRYLDFLSKKKTRNKFIEKLYHFSDFDWRLFREIHGTENESQAIKAKIKSYRNILSCSVISVNAEYDGKVISVEDAITNVVGIEASILIFDNAEIVYYEGESPKRRYINI